MERGAAESEDGPVQALRERLVQSPGALADAELLGLLFGGRGRTVRGLGEALLGAAGGLRALASMEASELATAAGLGRERAAQVLAALELARRAHLAPDARPRLRTAGEVHRYLSPRIALLRHEVFHVLSFNTRNVLLADARVAEGTTDACTVDPREVFRAALGARATAVIFAHNHPSGDPEPSEADLALTRELQAGARIFHLRVLDHLVVGAGRYVSLARAGFLHAVPAVSGEALTAGGKQ
ncbi:MAG: RadC family protein [Myxococcaceae bacterium]